MTDIATPYNVERKCLTSTAAVSTQNDLASLTAGLVLNKKPTQHQQHSYMARRIQGVSKGHTTESFV